MKIFIVKVGQARVLYLDNQGKWLYIFCVLFTLGKPSKGRLFGGGIEAHRE